ncbi:hypothetical protein LOK49_LG09G01288 [Camellia lanceoleosa]|uniref:Uncharacterized protein n=1 Tax=Camellia lanceoleosa TaxID=1840588 RepID=A0ACC0GGB1_9ERIC|nr:hypothetical protein LOK49_LG09G01288 [Camellia lanceoleosa]
MERKKKRKALDKEKRHAPSDNVEPKPKQLDMKFDETRVPMLTLASSGLPEFHISEVQSMYDKLERKDVAEGGLQLEAEKDDGLNNCAPSLRYAGRRLIRGVSSSRETVELSILECCMSLCRIFLLLEYAHPSLIATLFTTRLCGLLLLYSVQDKALHWVLTVLVGAIPNIKVDALLKLIVDLLEVSSSMKGQVGKSSFMFKVDFGVVLFPEATLPLRVIQPNFIAAIERALCQVDTPYTIDVVHRDLDNGRMRFATVGTTAEANQNNMSDLASIRVLLQGQDLLHRCSLPWIRGQAILGNPPSYVGSSLGGSIATPNLPGGTLPNQPTIDRSVDSHSYGGGSFASNPDSGRYNATKYPCYVPQNVNWCWDFTGSNE